SRFSFHWVANYNLLSNFLANGLRTTRARRVSHLPTNQLKEFPMSKILRFSFAAFLVFTISAIAFGQSTTTGAIGGLVTNPNKEVIPGASVTVKNTGTNKEDSATTDDQGRFRIVNLEPGT